MLLPIFGWCYCQVWQMLLSNYRLMLLPMYYYWLMLLPLGDVIANCVEDVKPQAFNFCNKCDGWCYCLVADGMTTAGWLGRCYLPWVRCYFNFSSVVLNRTSSHMWGRKLTAVSKSLSLSKNQISCYWETIHYIETNRMRNLHLHHKDHLPVCKQCLGNIRTEGTNRLQLMIIPQNHIVQMSRIVTWRMI